MRALLLLIPVVAALACTSPEAQPEMTSLPKNPAPSLCAPGDARLRAAVRSGHAAPDIKSLERICVGVAQALREISADRSGWGLERLRAIELLAAYPSVETNELLGKLALANDDLLSVRRTALTVLAASKAPVPADLMRSVDDLAAHDADPDLRAVATDTAQKLRSQAR